VSAADPLVFTAIAAIFGAIVGSFLNVCIHRLPRGESIVHPPSRCPQCGHRLAWYENIPVLSWIGLGGRCRGCRAHISVMYPVVELTTAAVFAAAASLFGPTPLLGVRLVFAASMIVLAVTDLRERLLPNAITYPGVVVGLLASLALPPGIVSALIGATGFALVLWGIGEVVGRFMGREALGFGDVKMAAMIGAFLGWPLAVLTFALVGVVGTALAILVVVIMRDRHYEIPLGTMLAAAALVAAFWGPGLVDWYLYSFSGLPR
jgi:leader peptidase (prepilin peptidase)/N-methyltransferase